MSRTRQSHKMLRRYAVALALLSLSFLFMPIATGLRKSTKIPIYTVGGLFWIALIATIVTAVAVNRQRRKNAHPERKKPLALTHFFQGKKMLIIDTVMLVSLVAFAVAYFLAWHPIVQFLFIALFVFSFGMHCMANVINDIEKSKQVRGEAKL